MSAVAAAYRRIIRAAKEGRGVRLSAEEAEEELPKPRQPRTGGAYVFGFGPDGVPFNRRENT